MGNHFAKDASRLIPGVSVLYSYQSDDGLGIIRRHSVLRVTKDAVVVNECPIGFTWRDKAISVPRDQLESNGNATAHHTSWQLEFFIEPQPDWHEGWLFGGPSAGLIEALQCPDVQQRLQQTAEREQQAKLKEHRLHDRN